MELEDQPIADEEWLIRLVWGDRVTSRTPIISPGSSRPRPDEATGTSFFRLACLREPTDALFPIDEAERGRYALVLVGVATLRRLHCKIAPAPIPQIAGHVLVPEINPEAYRTEKQGRQTLFLDLAVEASANIIRPPLI